MPDPLYEDQVPPDAPGIPGNGIPDPFPPLVPAPAPDPALHGDQVPPPAPPVPGNDEPAVEETAPDGGHQADNG